MHCSKLSLFVVALVLAADVLAVRAQQSAAPVPASIAVQPAAIELGHVRQPVAIQVLGAAADGFSLDLRDQAKFSSADARWCVRSRMGRRRFPSPSRG